MRVMQIQESKVHMQVEAEYGKVSSEYKIYTSLSTTEGPGSFQEGAHNSRVVSHTHLFYVLAIKSTATCFWLHWHSSGY